MLAQQYQPYKEYKIDKEVTRSIYEITSKVRLTVTMHRKRPFGPICISRALNTGSCIRRPTQETALATPNAGKKWGDDSGGKKNKKTRVE